MEAIIPNMLQSTQDIHEVPKLSANNALDSAHQLILEVLPDCSRVVAHYYKTEESREDMMQELVAHLLIKYPKYNPSHPFLNWSLKLTSNFCKSKLRYQKIRHFFSIETHLPQEPPSKLDDPHNQSAQQNIRSLTRQAIESLKEKDREVILLCDILEKNDKDVANILGIKDTNLRVRKSRARQKLKDELIRMGYEHD